jgi:transcriptional regulator with XRE-family HTH domain
MAQKTATGLPTIGAIIRAWRLFRRLTSTELSKKAGVRIAYLSEIEHDRTINPKEKYLVKLADALGVPLQDIYGRRTPPEKESEEESEDGEVENDEEHEIDAPTYSMVNAAIGIPDLLFGTTGEIVEEIKHLLDSLSLTDEEDEIVAAQLDTTKRLLKFILGQRNARKIG